MKFRLHRPLRSTVLAFGVGLNLFAAMLTVMSAYGGMFDPETRVVMAMIAMTLPAVLAVDLLLMVADFFFDKRLVLVILASWLLSLPPLLDFCPLNIYKGKSEGRTFTFMTYNVLHFMDFRGENPDLKANVTLSHILASDADIVNIQESDVGGYDYSRLRFGQSGAELRKDYWHMTQSQLDSLYERYPYRAVNHDRELSVFSKYPLTPVAIDVPADVSYAMKCFRLDVDGCQIHLVNVHLKSIGLSDSDKELYKEALRDVPENKGELKREIIDVKSKLLSKLASAFRARAEEARAVRAVIDSIGGPFIVAGDFNDIPDCYAVRTIMGADMHDAYADAAFGPTITYHADRFYFRIDQILYRGPFKAVDIERNPVGSSDHNPLFATFMFDVAGEKSP